ncbi:GntR family transcriptional regulator [Microbacterium xanthum]|uniref:GntR family transcriptional regulator n=1 Tax=Microbacterium xanthum TaxID=3079794 RepID=UPI002AD2C63C|nr:MULTISPECIES: GntR family transcriptional regulator [unclassified Microbacterium]MDZ8172521.1 GntR family transcriptional regulator [Microbacterium sp. KSW-48]MDZ8202642.1 GntR family transcriptional regulator [Microbacterium sp. SSW1-59]
MRLAIDTTVSTPPFEQVRAQIVEAVRDGSLTAGARLSPVRTLAQELDVAPGTVARAYRELELAGVIETRGRAGTFVAMSTDPARRRIELAAEDFAAQARLVGMDPSDALALVADALRR